MGAQVVPEASVARLGVYLHALQALASLGHDTVSSVELADASGVAPPTLRRDLSHLGSYGTRGVGYDVAQLLAQLGRALGVDQCTSVVLVGAGHLGTALAGYAGFTGRGFRVVALLDVDPARVGEPVGDLVVRPVSELPAVVAGTAGVLLGVVATPAASAQSVCDALVAAGVSSVLSFAPVALEVPCGVDLRRVDLANELQILAFHAARRYARPAAVPA